jgi:hypothetical protein
MSSQESFGQLDEAKRKEGRFYTKTPISACCYNLSKEQKLFFDFETFNFIFYRMLVGYSVLRNATGLFLP